MASIYGVLTSCLSKHIMTISAVRCPLLNIRLPNIPQLLRLEAAWVHHDRIFHQVILPSLVRCPKLALTICDLYKRTFRHQSRLRFICRDQYSPKRHKKLYILQKLNGFMLNVQCWLMKGKLTRFFHILYRHTEWLIGWIFVQQTHHLSCTNENCIKAVINYPRK